MDANSMTTIEPAEAQALMATVVDWAKYDGMRVSSSSGPEIYLAMWGALHYIPNPATFESVFRDWSGVVRNDYLVDTMPRSSSLSDGSFIASAAGARAQYFVTLRNKLWIPDPATVARFNFAPPVSLPPLALALIPTGPNVS